MSFSYRWIEAAVALVEDWPIDIPKPKDAPMSRMSELPYPSSPGYKEPSTSKAAARAIQPHVSALARSILSLIRYNPMTPDEAANALGRTLLTIRPRFSELAKKGLIEKTGARRPNASGLLAHVWRQSL